MSARAEQRVALDDGDAKPTANNMLFRCILVTCFLLALFMRVYGINVGLPHLYAWDEPTVVNRAMRFGSGDFNPHFFYYPGFYMYVIFAVEGAFFLIGKLTGRFHSSQDFAVEYFTNPSNAYLVARLTTALVGTAAVVVTYYLGKKLYGARTGLFSSVFLSVSVLQTSHSHIAVTDVPQSLLITAACIPIYNVMRRGHRQDYLLAGLLIGLGAATKYLAILIIPSLIVAHLFYIGDTNISVERDRSTLIRAGWFNLVLAFVAIFAGFFVGSPYNVLDFRHFVIDFRHQSELSGLGDGHSIVAYYLFSVLPADFGWPLIFVAVAGMVMMIWSRNRTNLLFIVFPVLYFLFVAHYPQRFARYMIPEDAFVAIMAAYGFSRVIDNVSKQADLKRYAVAIAIAGVIAMTFPQLRTVWRCNKMMAGGGDTRTQTLTWVEQHVQIRNAVAIEALYDRTFLNVPLLTDASLAKLARDMPNTAKFRAVREQVLTALRRRPVYHEIAFTQDFEALKRSGVSYVFLSDAMSPPNYGFKQKLTDLASNVYSCAPSDESVGGIASDTLPAGIFPPVLHVYYIP